ncbi:hypothetical protein PV379_00755 [Streptomyces caniscabiei]|uniref:hypothetical protein n=1 Tax=Streptomyces caniscabiei TaxID=2746961 RepID=UPI0029B28108|nr:hypothetical protein [Streptomyces caniscabiei]MDX2775886.1 hypothetical protein [Streptomyces caniscabiei]
MTITVVTLAVALRREEPFNDDAAFRDVEPYIGELPRIIERRGWTNKNITLRRAYRITADFLAYMIESGYAKDMIIARAALIHHLESLEEDVHDVRRLCRAVNRSEYSIFLEQSELNDEARQLYRKRKLTCGRALSVCPRIYFQYESAG